MAAEEKKITKSHMFWWDVPHCQVAKSQSPSESTMIKYPHYIIISYFVNNWLRKYNWWRERGREISVWRRAHFHSAAAVGMSSFRAPGMQLLLNSLEQRFQAGNRCWRSTLQEIHKESMALPVRLTHINRVYIWMNTIILHVLMYIVYWIKLRYDK